MSSNFEVQRICEYCSNEFTARTTVTRFCSRKCSSASHKQKVRAGKIEQSNKQTHQIKTQPIEELKAKEFLTVREVARLLNCSVRSAYYYIESGTIKAVNLGQRITRVKRSEIDYSFQELKLKFGFSQRGIEDFVKRNGIPKIKKGWFVYVPKTVIDKLLS